MKTRQRAWARGLAGWLAARHVAPNWISTAGVLAAALGGLCLVLVPAQARLGQALLLLAAAGFIPLRLLANMLDGLVAIEGGLKTPMGELFNEVPDRVSDALLLVAAGYSVPLGPWGPFLGWLGALLAVGTAYVRLLGGTLGQPQDFRGPMAKPQRMAVLAGACLLSIAEALGPGYAGRVLGAALVVIVLGSAATIGRRTAGVARRLAGR